MHDAEWDGTLRLEVKGTSPAHIGRRLTTASTSAGLALPWAQHTAGHMPVNNLFAACWHALEYQADGDPLLTWAQTPS